MLTSVTPMFVDMPEASRSGLSREPDASPLSGTNILIVEGSRTRRSLYKFIFAEAGANVICARDIESGMYLAAEQEFNLVLLDMQMPGCEESSAITMLRHKGISTPIIAHGVASEEVACRNAGCSEFLAKPTDAEKLLVAASDTLSRQRFEDCETTCQIDESTIELAVGKPESVIEDDSCPDDSANDQAGYHCTLDLTKPVYLEILFEFIDELPQRFEAMKAALGDNRLDELADLAHGLKGSAGSIGFHAFTEPCRQLERLAKQKESAQLEAVIKELQNISHRIVVPNRSE
ncbi:MAG: response regulator [Planctomycetaceae bacterium]|nr:response regulator [Planctomycetales bacterium]MCB9927490.1 response regulator [Planctomycetaceae bacterium]